ncbi:MAG: carbonic anhydrase, partial [Lentisphaeria bacterium]
LDSTISTLSHSGINVKDWLKGFGSVEAAIQESVSMTKNHPLMPKGVRVHGLIMDSETGKLQVIVNGE